MKWGAIAICALLLVGCSASDPEPSVTDGAVIVKICIDGSRIFRLRDGRFMAGGWGGTLVDNPETVCAAK